MGRNKQSSCPLCLKPMRSDLIKRHINNKHNNLKCKNKLIKTEEKKSESIKSKIIPKSLRTMKRISFKHPVKEIEIKPIKSISKWKITLKENSEIKPEELRLLIANIIGIEIGPRTGQGKEDAITIIEKGVEITFQYKIEIEEIREKLKEIEHLIYIDNLCTSLTNEENEIAMKALTKIRKMKIKEEINSNPRKLYHKIL